MIEKLLKIIRDETRTKKKYIKKYNADIWLMIGKLLW